MHFYIPPLTQYPQFFFLLFKVMDTSQMLRCVLCLDFVPMVIASEIVLFSLA